MRYTKPPLSFDLQLKQLIDRGLTVSNKPEAIKTLEKICYYRLSAYFLPFQDQKDIFRKDVTFEEILKLYEFDRQLRFIYFEAVEGIEIALRTSLTYSLSHALGPFGYSDPQYFLRGFTHQKWLSSVEDEITRSKETFIQHYKLKYAEMPHTPLWMATETFSFGSLSIMYQGLRDRYKIPLSSRANINHQIMGSWFHTLCYMRNICAHHSRLWNKYIAIKPRFLGTWSIRPQTENSLFPVTLVIAHLLRQFNINIPFKAELDALVVKTPSLDVSKMGFPQNWRDLI